MNYENDNANVEELAKLYDVTDALKANLERVIIGKNEIIELMITGLFSGGNVLLEDVPGVGKTTLAKAMAKSLDVTYKRIQFTPDMLPADILGGAIFNPQTGEFKFRKGPIFTNVLLADEINRASPRTQSALLEAMTEKYASIDGVPRAIPQPFIVIATQNPVEYHGTYPLPEAQLDRFMLKLEIGYPNQEQESSIILGKAGDTPLAEISPIANVDTLTKIQKVVDAIAVDRDLANYIVAIAHATRNDDRFRLGASPRASIMLRRASQGLAFINRRDYIIPDDVKQVLAPVIAHRLVVDSKARYGGVDKLELLQDLTKKIPVPI